jgi:hypothetical protein
MLEEDQGGSMRRRLKVDTAMSGLAALMLGGALVSGSNSAARADGAGTANAASAGQMCASVIVKVRAKHWVWVKETRKIHGRRAFVRRHGKMVFVHVRVSYLKTEHEQLCTATPLAGLTPPSPVTPSAPVGSPPAEVVTPTQRPVDSSPPNVGGSTRAGQTLTAEPGTWSGSPTTYTYQWQRCDSAGASCSAISAATSSTYRLGGVDVGATLRVSVIASNAGGAGSPATSSATAVVAASSPPVPVNTRPPTITGTAQQEQTLTEVHGEWTNSPDRKSVV